MDSPTSTEKIFQCFDCPDGVQIFATEEALLTHKWDVIRASRARSHMACHVCKLDHRTFEGLVRHYQLSHPTKQKLSCPGCKEPFARLHLMMRHLEGDLCPKIMSRSLVENRRQQALITSLTVKNGGLLGAADASTTGDMSGLGGASGAGAADSVSGAGDEASAARLLNPINQAEHLGIFNLSGVSVGDYGRFLGIESTKEDYRRYVAGGGRLQLGDTKLLDPTPGTPTPLPEAMRPGLPAATAAGATPRGPTMRLRGRAPGSGVRISNVWQSPVLSIGEENSPSTAPPMPSTVQDFRRGDIKAPDLLTDDASRRGVDVWSGQDVLVPQGSSHQNAKQKSSSLLEGIQKINISDGDGGAATASGVPSLHHPDHRDFNVKKYRNPHSGRFNCPVDRCIRAGKNFKTATGLIMHLRSSTAHETVRLQCPSCFNFFLNLEALTQHCESQSVRCRFRDAEEFVPFLNILSGGVADIKGRNIDLTVSYGVKESASQTLLQDGVAGNSTLGGKEVAK